MATARDSEPEPVVPREPDRRGEVTGEVVWTTSRGAWPPSRSTPGLGPGSPRETIRQDRLARWEAIDTYISGRVPTSSAHDLVPPLFATLAEAELALGGTGTALALARPTSHRNARPA
jgi:hypothetical protein